MRATSMLTSSSDTVRELRSGLPGFGGRPTLHPAWDSGLPSGANRWQSETAFDAPRTVTTEKSLSPSSS